MDSSPPREKWLKVKEVSVLYNLSLRTVRRLMASNQLPFAKTGLKKGYRISSLEMDRFLALGGTRRPRRRVHGRVLTKQRAQKIAARVRREGGEPEPRRRRRHR